MTTQEFSNAFDILLNSYNNTGIPGMERTIGGLAFDEYEKSVFLTQAQTEVIIELYSGRNERGASFEGTEELRTYLKDLIKTVTIKEDTEDNIGLTKYSKFFKLPSDVLFITYEAVTLDDKSLCNDNPIVVVPTIQDDLHSVIENPFKWPSNRRALRLDKESNTAEIISKYNIKEYIIRYISKPSPIILTTLENDKIDGLNTITECKLHPTLHGYILRKAVALALASRGSQGNMSN